MLQVSIADLAALREYTRMRILSIRDDENAGAEAREVMDEEQDYLMELDRLLLDARTRVFNASKSVDRR